MERTPSCATEPAATGRPCRSHRAAGRLASAIPPPQRSTTTVISTRRTWRTPDLRAARARWPFVCTWDDHEFANNCWQSHDEPEAFQTGRAAASRAWFEFVPAILSESAPVAGVSPRARDLQRVDVEDAPFGEAGQIAPEDEPNNLAAIGSITLYRSLRFGRNVDLVVTDSRSYRSDHCVPGNWAEERVGFELRSGDTVPVPRSLDGTPPFPVDSIREPHRRSR